MKPSTNPLKTRQTFTIKSLPDLDVCVLAALELFARQKVPALNLQKFKHPLVLGSGNAAGNV